MSKSLITSLGWEPRFLSGIDDILKNETPNHILIFKPLTFFQETGNKTTISLSKKLHTAGISHDYHEFDNNNHVETWRTAINALAELEPSIEIILDITTMPRYLIWACLHCLDSIKAKFKCIYYPPDSYGKWLSSDTGKPQMVFRHSGVAYPDRPTCLLLFSGFDTSRTQHFVDFFEPKKVILIIQEGDQLDNNARCVENLRGNANIQTAKLNSYSDPITLKNKISELVYNSLDDFNIVATTVGPRPSTIALYILNRETPSIGLVHANAHQYNENYSYGINIPSKFESIINFS
ncbi:hypothetical protein [Pseudomonas capsici]|uniref:hypothetical protein n=1 Tax=Pseudomonas capsici TaxID=2810614 RepID=UPI0021F1746B|nr:hypothetical protein [Pseudomonas capsici]MCV4342251.1 hypothetical protein [Pseudomonas capsici]